MIHFACLATNKYRTLGVRLRDGLRTHFRGDFHFHVFSDVLSDQVHADTSFYYRSHANWVAAVNDKFPCVASLSLNPEDQVIFLDADTRVYRDISADDFTGELVAWQHFGDQTWMRHQKGFDRFAKSACFVPFDTPHPQMWFMGAIWGGRFGRVKRMLRELTAAQVANRRIGHEPGVNDESYLNHYFHYNPPTRVCPWPQGYPFIVSDKGGAECLRT